MPKIINLKKEEINIVNKFKKGKLPISDNLIKINKDLGFNLLDLLPQNSYNKVSFTLKDSSSSFANAIRRVLASEFPVWSLTVDKESFDIHDLYTNDPYIKYDELETRVNAMPIHQSYLNKISDKESNKEKFINHLLKFKINVKNDTPDHSIVVSEDITIISNDKSNKNITIKDFAFDRVHLQTLSPASFLKIKLKLERGYGYEHGGKFSITPMPYYLPHNKPLETHHKSKSTGVSSLEVDPTECDFKYTTYTYYKNPL